MRSVWCIVVALGLMAAGGHARTSEHAHAGTCELHAAPAPAVVATRRATYTPHLAPFMPAATRGIVAVPRIAIAEPGAASAGFLELDRASSRSSRGPPRA